MSSGNFAICVNISLIFPPSYWRGTIVMSETFTSLHVRELSKNLLSSKTAWMQRVNSELIVESVMRVTDGKIQK